MSPARQWSEGEHVGLRAVAHRRVTVAARDSAGINSAVHVRGHLISFEAGRKCRRSGVRRFRTMTSWVVVVSGA